MHLKRLSQRAWFLTPVSRTDRPVLGVIEGDRTTLVVDAGNSAAHARQLAETMAAKGLRPLGRADMIALTHWHWDHVFGAAHLPAAVIASRATDAMLGVMAGWRWDDAALDERVAAKTEIAFCRTRIRRELPEPRTVRIRRADRTIDGPVDIDLGGVTARLIPVGGDHAPDSIVVFVPEEKVLFLSDCAYPDIYHGPQRYDAAVLLPLLDRLSALDADVLLWGHDRTPMPRAAFLRFADVCRIVAAGGDVPGDEDAAWLRSRLAAGR
jgi:glyoxylase-like metal-dependent hydrolase (beta-lactamase superfamily II)